MIFATGRKSLCGSSRPSLQLSGGARGVHTEGLNYLSSLNEVGDVGWEAEAQRGQTAGPGPHSTPREQRLDTHPSGCGQEKAN